MRPICFGNTMITAPKALRPRRLGCPQKALRRNDGLNPQRPGGDPLITIIVPVWNAEAFLPRFLRSLRAQTWPNLELLLVDDGSTDRSPELLDTAAAADARIHVLHLPHRGVAFARNAALDEARGDYLMFADTDDLVDPQYAELLYRVSVYSGAPVVTCPAKDVCGEPESDIYSCDTEKEACLKGLSPSVKCLSRSGFDYLRHESHKVVWGAIYRRDVVSGLRFSGKYAVSTDTLFFARVLSRCQTIVHLDVPLYCYIMREGSVSSRPYDRKRFDDILVWLEISRFFGRHRTDTGTSAEALAVWKSVAFLKALASQDAPADRKLEKALAACLRFRYRAVFYLFFKWLDRDILRNLLFVTAPLLYLRMSALRKRIRSLTPR